MTPTIERQPWQPELPKSPRPIVVIGCGGIVRDAHLPAYKLVGFEVAGCTDVDPAAARSLATTFNLRAVDSIAELSKLAKSPIFDVAVPASAIPKVLDQIPEGSAVLIQKPLGEDLSQAKGIVEQCMRKKFVAAVNFQLRYAPYILAAKHLIDTGAIGELHDMEVRVTVYMPWHLWTFLEKAPRVEILYHSVHYVDLIRSFLGEPTRVHALSIKHPDTLKLHSTRTNMALDFGQTTRANIETNHGHKFGLTHQESYVKWEGTRGAIKATLGLLMNYPKGEPDGLQVCTLDDAGNPTAWRDVPFEGSWYPHGFIGSMASIMRFVEGSSKELPTRVEDALRTMAVVEAAYTDSATGGTEVTLYSAVELRGMTWDHPRGIDPLVAHAREYEKKHGVKIDWDARPLEDFETHPLGELAEAYDLIVIDHPHVGMAAASGCLVALDVPAKGQAVGGSNESYHFAGKQWALAIDAAAQVSCRRAGALDHWPQNWDEVLELCRDGQVLWPLKAVHALMSFYTLCANFGSPCATAGPELVDRAMFDRVLELLQRFAERLPDYCFELNPIGVFHWMRRRRSALYVPLTYGYVTYSQAPSELEFGNIPGTQGSTLGGTGIAVSARSRQQSAAVAVAHDLASAAVQRGMYAQAGGQPAHRDAWTDPRINADSQNFYRNTLATLDASYLRPRFNGYIAFQQRAGVLVSACAEGLITIASTIDRINDLFAHAQGLK